MSRHDENTLRQEQVALLRAHYTDFRVFLRDMMQFLGFSPTWMQYDIGEYLQHGPSNLMIQAQRGEAKTTITAIFAVWSLIMDTTTRVVIVSAGEKMTKEIATLITKLIMQHPDLEALRPGRGDRTSVEAFDIHGSLKGVDKSPSVSCLSIGANLPGTRGDLIIADDIESPKNSHTAALRERLGLLSKEFSAWTTRDTARIVYLGTPQSTDSIYNSLPGQGFDLRIWPGRYPTAQELPNYGPYLAPSLVTRMEADPSLMTGGHVDGSKGKPTDPELFDEEEQVKKWMVWREAGYQLQYMLNTRLVDALKFPLKSEQLVLCTGNGLGKYPMAVERAFNRALLAVNSGGRTYHMADVHSMSPDLAEFEGVYMHIDPAGGGANADETAYAVTGFLNGKVWLLAVGGVPGGYADSTLQELAAVAARWKPHCVGIEKNYGHGAFAAVFTPVLRRALPVCQIEEPYVSGRKELRIIDTLEPVMAAGQLIVTTQAMDEDAETSARYGADQAATYSVLHQLTHITRVPRCLKHDDRVDALEGAVRKWVQRLAVDAQAEVARKQEAEWAKFVADPLGRNRVVSHAPARTGPNMLNKYRR